MEFTRITVDHKLMGGVPCVRGLRIPVESLVRMFQTGMTISEILSEYPGLEAEDIRESLQFWEAAKAGEI